LGRVGSSPRIVIAFLHAHFLTDTQCVCLLVACLNELPFSGRWGAICDELCLIAHRLRPPGISQTSHAHAHVSENNNQVVEEEEEEEWAPEDEDLTRGRRERAERERKEKASGGGASWVDYDEPM